MAKYNRYREEEKEENNNQEKQEEKIYTAEELQKMYDDKNNDYLKALADLENFKKRANEEMIRDRMYANQALLEDLITNFDIFEKALNVETSDPNVKNFLVGFQYINANFKQTLEKYGVKKIDAVGKKFDPQFHHAVETEYDETKEEDIVLAEIQTGYMLKERVLRPSLVKVNKKENNK